MALDIHSFDSWEEISQGEKDALHQELVDLVEMYREKTHQDAQLLEGDDLESLQNATAAVRSIVGDPPGPGE